MAQTGKTEKMDLTGKWNNHLIENWYRRLLDY